MFGDSRVFEATLQRAVDFRGRDFRSRGPGIAGAAGWGCRVVGPPVGSSGSPGLSGLRGHRGGRPPGLSGRRVSGVIGAAGLRGCRVVGSPGSSGRQASGVVGSSGLRGHRGGRPPGLSGRRVSGVIGAAGLRGCRVVGPPEMSKTRSLAGLVFIFWRCRLRAPCPGSARPVRGPPS